MDRTDLVLAVLAASDGAAHTPVQVQKLFFLIDQKIPTFIGGAKFDFQPFDYGPFDHAVYRELESLSLRGLVEIGRTSDGRMNSYRATSAGLQMGRDRLGELDPVASDFIRRLSNWVRNQSFADLVSAIYREFPLMKVNSVFRGC